MVQSTAGGHKVLDVGAKTTSDQRTQNQSPTLWTHQGMRTAAQGPHRAPAQCWSPSCLQAPVLCCSSRSHSWSLGQAGGGSRGRLSHLQQRLLGWRQWALTGALAVSGQGEGVGEAGELQELWGSGPL